MEKKTLVVVGAGKGLGNHVAAAFGTRDFRVILMARREEKLAEYAAELRAEGIDADYQVVDCADNGSIRYAFAAVKAKYGAVDVLVYNAAVLVGGNAEEISPEELCARFQVDVVGALTAAQQVIPEQAAQGNGTILFTGGGLALSPNPEHTSLSVHKAALRVLAITMHEELEEKGIYVGVVNIKGGIGMDDHYAPDKIAELYYQMYKTRNEAEVTY